MKYFLFSPMIEREADDALWSDIKFLIRRLQMWPRLRDCPGWDILSVFPIRGND